MNDKWEVWWKVEATVQPRVEWENTGIDSFKAGGDEVITLEKQFEDRTIFSLTVQPSGGEVAMVHDRAELLMKSFLACLELEAGMGYRFAIGSIKPVEPTRVNGGGVLLDAVVVQVVTAVRKFVDLDLTLFRELSSSLEVLSVERRNRIMGALEFLYDGLTAHTPQQCFLSIYGGLNYLISGEVSAGKTTRREDQIAVRLAQKGILLLDEVERWMADFDSFDRIHYDALQGKQFNEREVDRIKNFFAQFLTKYIDYLKVEPDKKPRTTG
jgi:hypothetical protein